LEENVKNYRWKESTVGDLVGSFQKCCAIKKHLKSIMDNSIHNCTLSLDQLLPKHYSTLKALPSLDFSHHNDLLTAKIWWHALNSAKFQQPSRSQVKNIVSKTNFQEMEASDAENSNNNSPELIQHLSVGKKRSLADLEQTSTQKSISKQASPFKKSVSITESGGLIAAVQMLSAMSETNTTNIANTKNITNSTTNLTKNITNSTNVPTGQETTQQFQRYPSHQAQQHTPQTQSTQYYNLNSRYQNFSPIIQFLPFGDVQQTKQTQQNQFSNTQTTQQQHFILPFPFVPPPPQQNFSNQTVILPPIRTTDISRQQQQQQHRLQQEQNYYYQQQQQRQFSPTRTNNNNNNNSNNNNNNNFQPISQSEFDRARYSFSLPSSRTNNEQMLNSYIHWSSHEQTNENNEGSSF
jgi:hypothetical protein